MSAKDEKEITVAVTCLVCKEIILTNDRRRQYCDSHREWRDGEYRKKGWLRKYHQDNKSRYRVRQTRVTGTGFSEHLRFSKDGKPDFIRERIAVRKERKRMGI